MRCLLTVEMYSGVAEIVERGSSEVVFFEALILYRSLHFEGHHEVLGRIPRVRKFSTQSQVWGFDAR